MSEQEPTPRQQLAIDRELARARSDARFEELVSSYPPSHQAGRDRFIRVESEKTEKDVRDRQLQAIPEADRGRLKR